VFINVENGLHCRTPLWPPMTVKTQGGRRQRETNNKTPYTHRPLLGPPDSIMAFDWLLNSYSSKTVIKHAAYSERMMLATDISDLVEMLPFSI